MTPSEKAHKAWRTKWSKWDLEARFWQKVKKGSESDCWPWTGAKLISGYGHMRYRTKSIYAHRLAFQFTYGPIPKGLFICHHCDNPQCCNPIHLFSGSAADNLRDCEAKRRRRFAVGKKIHTCKLDPKRILEIRKKLRDGVLQRLIATIYGVDKSTVSDINTRKTWAHV